MKQGPNHSDLLWKYRCQCGAISPCAILLLLLLAILAFGCADTASPVGQYAAIPVRNAGAAPPPVVTADFRQHSPTSGLDAFQFVLNRGQWDQRARYMLDRGEMRAWFTDDGVLYDLNDRQGNGHVLRQRFIGAVPTVPHGNDRQEGHRSYIRGEQGMSAGDIPSYGSVGYKNIYPGIDIRYYRSGNQLKYDLLVAPGADPSVIRFTYDGADAVTVEPDGRLSVATSLGTLREERPVCYQESNGARRGVAAAFLHDERGIGFQLGSYDPTRTLVIDPTVIYSSYLGGRRIDEGRGVTIDNAGNIYVVGLTLSENFPITTGAYGIGNRTDMFVVKLDPTGSRLLYGTYIGGTGDDEPTGVRVLNDGTAVVAGTTFAPDSTSFPTTSNAMIKGRRKGRDGVVLALRPDGSALTYSSYLGGSSDDAIEGLALDRSGNAYVTGWTRSIDFPFTPITYDSTLEGIEDAFVVKLNPTSGAFFYSTLVGGDGADRGTAIAVDPGGAPHVTGWTASSNFPTTTNAYSRTNKGGRDAFIVRLRYIDEQLLLEYGTLVGGRANDLPSAIALDSTFPYLPVITGVTASDDYPITRPGDQGPWFVSKFTSPNNLVSRLLGVTGDTVGGITVQTDKSGTIYLCGATRFASGFPTTTDAVTGSPRGKQDLVFLRMNASGDIGHSSVIGGSADELPWRSSYLGRTGELLVTGITYSRDFPVSRSAFDRRLNDSDETGPSDGFIMRFAFAQQPSISGPATRRFDTLRCDSTRLDTFYVYNTGDADLVIRASIFLNGATSFRIERPGNEIQTIRPGDSLRYVIRYTSQLTNSETNVLQIFNNDPVLGKDTLRISISATRIDPQWRAVPSALKFKTVPACVGGGADTMSVLVQNDGGDTLHITAVEFAVGQIFSFTAPLTLPKTLPQSTGVDIYLGFQPKRDGTFYDTVIVRIAECDRPIRVPLEVTADSVGLAIDGGNDISFPPVSPCASESETTITLTNTGKTSVTIQSGQIGGAGFSVLPGQLPMTIPKGQSRGLQLRFSPSFPGSVGARLTLRGEPCNLERSVNLSGTALANDSVRANVDTLDFGLLSACANDAGALDSTIVLYNRGNQSLVFDEPLLTAPFALAVSGAFPATVAPGDSLLVVLRYAPGSAGRHDDSVRFPFRAGICDDTVRLGMHGEREDISLEPETSRIEITDLSECEQYRDTSLVLYNRSGVAIVVDTVLVTSGLEEVRPSSPFTIAANGNTTLRLRFRPQQAGLATEVMQLVLGPCGDTMTIAVEGSKQGIVLGFDEREIQIPTRLVCVLPDGLDTVATLHNAGNSPVTGTIAAARIIGPPGSPFSLGENVVGRTVKASGSIPIPIRFAPVAVGSYTATLELILDPCGDTLRLPLSGTIIDTRLTVEGGAFGTIRAGSSQQTTLVVRNPLQLPVLIDSIESLIAPFKLIGTSPPLPAVLGTGDSLVVEVEFAPSTAGTFQQTSSALVSNPCSFAANLPLIGRATPQDLDTLIFCMDDETSGLSGDTVNLPVRVLTPRTLNGPVDIEYFIHYDSLRLELLHSIQTSALQIVMDDPIKGVAVIRQSGVTALQAQQLMLRFDLLVGPEERVAVRVDSVTITGGEVAAAACSDSAHIRISDRCIFTSFAFGKYRNLLGTPTPNPAATTIEITYQQLENARAVLRIWDVNGQEVLRPLDEELPGGRYTVRFSVSDLPSGRYFYGIEAGMYREVKGMVIER